MLLYRSRARWSDQRRFRLATQVAEDLAGHKAFEAPDDLPLAFGCSSPDVVEGRLVAPHPDNDHTVQGCVRLPIAAAVEPVPVGLAGRSRDRRGSAQVREGGLVVQPFGVVAGVPGRSL